jgi:hypothetical protein
MGVIEQRKIWPPRLVSVLIDAAWRPGHLLAWRRLPGAYQFLVERVVRRPGGERPEWVDPARVRPRRRPDLERKASRLESG